MADAGFFIDPWTFDGNDDHDDDDDDDDDDNNDDLLGSFNTNAMSSSKRYNNENDVITFSKLCTSRQAEHKQQHARQGAPIEGAP